MDSESGLRSWLAAFAEMEKHGTCHCMCKCKRWRYPSRSWIPDLPYVLQLCHTCIMHVPPTGNSENTKYVSILCGNFVLLTWVSMILNHFTNVHEVFRVALLPAQSFLWFQSVGCCESCWKGNDLGAQEHEETPHLGAVWKSRCSVLALRRESCNFTGSPARRVAWLIHLP